MQSMSINERQSKQLADDIGKMLAIQLDSQTVRNKVDRIVADYVKKNNIDEKPEALSKKISWSVKVTLKK